VFTGPIGINDNGTVVGTYVKNLNRGFIFHNGQWATLDYPHAVDTILVGIANDGKIIGNVFLQTFPERHSFTRTAPSR